jgi:hypothetical protein
VVSFTPLPLYPWGKIPRYPLDRILGGPQSRSARRGEEKILDPTGLELRPLGLPARSQSLYLLRFVGIANYEENMDPYLNKNSASDCKYTEIHLMVTQ